MYERLKELALRPEPWSVSTVKELWTRPHLAGEMLKHHLSQDSAHASRPVVDIDRVIAWLDGQLELAGRRVIDLGCGPGLYARRMARRGARVTGVDFSANSLDYARQRGEANVDYLLADYLEDELPSGFDLATLVYYDFCALPPAQRRRLLERIRGLLNPGGLLALDLYGPGAFDAVGEHIEIEPRLMGGFFAPGDYVGIQRTDVYEDERVTLDRFFIVEPADCWQIFNWAQYYSPETAVAELAEAGFMVAALTGGLDGTPLADDSHTLGVIAEAA